jgi:hypothetical protein
MILVAYQRILFDICQFRNTASYDKNNSSVGYTVRVHYVIQYVSRNIEIALVSKVCLTNK